jgi:hypothetical protein
MLRYLLILLLLLVLLFRLVVLRTPLSRWLQWWVLHPRRLLLLLTGRAWPLLAI